MQSLCVCVCGRSWPFSEGAGCSNSSCVSAFFNRVKHIIAVCGVRLRTRPEFNHHLFLKDTSHIHTEDNGQCIYQGSLPKPPGLPLSSSSSFPALYFLINAFSLSEKQKTKKENTGSMAPESRLMPTVIKPEKPCRGISGPWSWRFNVVWEESHSAAILVANQDILQSTHSKKKCKTFFKHGALCRQLCSCVYWSPSATTVITVSGSRSSSSILSDYLRLTRQSPYLYKNSLRLCTSTKAENVLHTMHQDNISQLFFNLMHICVHKVQKLIISKLGKTPPLKLSSKGLHNFSPANKERVITTLMRWRC